MLKGPVSRESDKTCQTVGHFYRPWGSIAESESDREIRRTLEKYETNKKHETNNFSKNCFLHIFSADREKISRDLVEIGQILSKSLQNPYQILSKSLPNP